MEYREVIRKRHASRLFTPQQVRVSELEDVITEAQRAPSWMDAQEREVLLATGSVAKMIRNEYMERAKNGVIGISDFTVVHRTEWSDQAQRNMDQFERNIEEFLGDEVRLFVDVQDYLFNAPAFIFLVLPKDASKWAILDLGAFEEAIIMGAADRGIDSIVAYSIIKYPDIIRKHFPISDNKDIVMGIALGYEDKEAKINQYRSKREPLGSFLTAKG